MKAFLIMVAWAIFTLASCSRSFAESRGNSDGLRGMSQLGLGQFSFNMAGDTFSNVDSITFEADLDSRVFSGTFVSGSAPMNLLEMACDIRANKAFAAKIPPTETDSKASGLFRVPEPTTIALFFAGVGTLLLFRRRHRLV